MVDAFLIAAERSQFGVFDLVEALLVIAVLLWTGLLAPADATPFPEANGLVARLSRTPARLALTIIAASLVLRGALLPWMPPPVPLIPDDFSLLLQADTFLAGRLANPPHELAAFFETIYVNQAPAYAAIYFPGRSVPLMIGILATGHPWAGIWASMIGLALATVWMLRAWVSPPLALLGGLLVIVRFGVFSFWINTHFGGSFTALGGVLVIGAFERLRHRIDLGNAAIFAAGVLILMLTRPLEGLLFCLPFGAVMVARIIAPGASNPWAARATLVAPLAIALVAGGALLAGQNFATTGSALVTPYALNRSAYALAPSFLTSDPITPTRTVPAYLHDYFVREAQPYARAAEPLGPVRIAYAKALTIALFAIGPAMLIPFLAGLGQWRRFRVPLLGTLAMLGGYFLTSWDWAHYLAPALGVFMLVIVVGFERLAQIHWRGRAVGPALTRALPLVVAAMLLVPIAALATDRPLPFTLKRSCCLTHTTSHRAAAEAALLAIPGKHLVLVRYDLDRPLRETWIANAARIDDARIIWANDLGPDRNLDLLAHYPGRQLWAVTLSTDTTPVLRSVPPA